jgi:hypothetical protein
MKIYVASSWRNERLTAVVNRLREAGHEVYDFRENEAFNWHDIEPDWEKWTPEQFRKNLGHPLSRAGFERDIAALREAEACVLVAPCGRSSHLELGIAIGNGIRTAILLAEGERPELSYRAAGFIGLNLEEILWWLKQEASA